MAAVKSISTELSGWTHVAIVLNNQQVIDATPGKPPVTIRDFNTFVANDSHAHYWIRHPKTTPSAQQINTLQNIGLELHRNSPNYNWIGVASGLLQKLGWIEDSSLFPTDKVHCAELVVYLLSEAFGFYPIAPHQQVRVISPAALAVSPYFTDIQLTPSV